MNKEQLELEIRKLGTLYLDLQRAKARGRRNFFYRSDDSSRSIDSSLGHALTVLSEDTSLVILMRDLERFFGIIDNNWNLSLLNKYVTQGLNLSEYVRAAERKRR